MKALEQAEVLYRRHGLDLAKDLAHYLQHGYVRTGPERVLLFRPCVSTRPEELATLEEADAWYVHLLVGGGHMRWMWEQLRAERVLPKMIWGRGARSPRVRICDFNQFGRLC